MKLKDSNDLIRDDESKAVISNNIGALQELKSKRAMSQKIDLLSMRVDRLEGALNTCNQLLAQLLEKHG